MQLSKEQAAKIDAIWSKAFADANKNAEKRYQIYGAARQEVIKNVLTEAQRSQLGGMSGQRTPMGQPTSAPTPRPLPPPLPPVEED